jgi:membrane-associated phospholipid phosphatase
MAQHKKRTGKQRTAIEDADVGAMRAATKYRHNPAIRFAGKVSELADQPPLIALSLATIGWGVVRGNGRVARAGLRMLAAHALATGIKTVIKTSVDRTRPALLVDHGRYELARGHDSDDHDRTSFPSGHTAGAVAVARAWSREFPEHTIPVHAAAAGVAAVQIPRATHFVSDVVAGAVIGFAAEFAVNALIGAFQRPVALHSGDGTG